MDNANNETGFTLQRSGNIGFTAGVIPTTVGAASGTGTTVTSGPVSVARGTTFFFLEVAAVGLVSVWAFTFTYLMLWVINKITPVRVTADEEEKGLDESQHGEEAYL